jgi:hypothetical protein
MKLQGTHFLALGLRELLLSRTRREDPQEKSETFALSGGIRH